MAVNREKVKSFNSDVLRAIVEGTSAETGKEFFDVLVRQLARAVGTKCAWVTEWSAENRRIHALSFWADGEYISNYEYSVTGSPCESVIENRQLVHFPEQLLVLYPNDSELKQFNAVSYMGIPLLDTNGELMGHLAVLDDSPMPENEAVMAIFNIFASRASAELRRLRRERELREREHKLSRLFEGAMDAILEFDSGFRITNLNASAAKVFGRSAQDAVGETLDKFLSADSNAELTYLIRELTEFPAENQSLWIPNGLTGIDPAGNPFPAEATLSLYAVEQRIYHTLILRSIHDRVLAEERIRNLLDETAYLRAEIEALQGFEEIVGESPALRRVLADVGRVAKTEATVLITGETGTGKELIARAIHRHSARAGKPLISVNCAAIAANLQESEFFGHEKGAFTGAAVRREGRFKLADGGTIFLDEIGEMSLDLQAKLLRAIQEGEFEPVGSSRAVRADVRIIAATNRDLEQMAKDGLFRTDLLYRLNVFPVHLPPLRERGDDIILLAEMFAQNLSKKSGRAVAPLTESFKNKLRRYEWRGNIRELQNVIERAFITSLDGRTLNLDRALPDASPEIADGSLSGIDGEDSILTTDDFKQIERRNIERALRASNGRISGSGGAADLLGLNANTLASRMKVLGISRR
jgi:PAS domain S-box-containing protein